MAEGAPGVAFVGAVSCVRAMLPEAMGFSVGLPERATGIGGVLEACEPVESAIDGAAGTDEGVV